MSSSGHILVVEDHPFYRHEISQLLVEEGYTVSEAANGEEALNMIGCIHFNFILTDIKMPRVSGIELIRSIRNRGDMTPIVAMSGYDDNELVALRTGANVFLSKGFNKEELLMHIESILSAETQADEAVREDGINTQNILRELTTIVQSSDHTVLAISIVVDLGTPLNEIAEVMLIPDEYPHWKIGLNDYLAILPALQSHNSIDVIIQKFYEQSQNSFLLVFGSSTGPWDSVNNLIESVTDDLVQRQKSQGIVENQGIAILKLHLDYDLLLDRIARARVHLEELEQGLGLTEQRIRRRIEQLIGGFVHDLMSFLGSSRGYSQLVRYLSDSTEIEISLLKSIDHITERCRQIGDSLRIMGYRPYERIQATRRLAHVGEKGYFAALNEEILVVEQDIRHTQQRIRDGQATSNTPDQLTAIAYARVLPLILSLEQEMLLLANTAQQLPNDEHQEDSANKRDNIKRIQGSARIGYLLTRNLLLTLHGIKLPEERMDLNAQIVEVVELLDGRIAPAVRQELTPDRPIVALSRVELSQVLMNLLLNASEATNTNGMLYVSTEVRQGQAILRIADTGIGIQEKNREHIFELYFSTKGRGTDSGIGLYIVRAIITQAGGQIGITSAVQDEAHGLAVWASGIADHDIPKWTASGTLFQVMLPCSDE